MQLGFGNSTTFALWLFTCFVVCTLGVVIFCRVAFISSSSQPPDMSLKLSFRSLRVLFNNCCAFFSIRFLVFVEAFSKLTLGRPFLFCNFSAVHVFAREELVENSAIVRWSFVKQDLQHCLKSGCIPNWEKISPLTTSVACNNLPGKLFSFTLEAGVVVYRVL